MALFKGKRKENLPDGASPKETSKSEALVLPVADLAHILVTPRITEKATDLTAGNVYVFDVARSASKYDVKKAIKALYKVNPVKVGMVKVPEKKIIVRGKRGVRAGGKKAYVYLKEGDKIEFV